MEKEDLVIEFHKKINQVEERFFTDIEKRIEAQQGLWERFSINQFGELKEEFKNIGGEKEVITFPFVHEFYIKGHKCKIELTGEIKVIE